MANPATPQGPSRHRLRRTGLMAAAAVSAVITVVASIVLATYVYAEQGIGTIPDVTGPVTGPSGSPPSPAYSGRCAEKSCNYLLLGSDSRQGLSKSEQEHFGTNADIGGSNRSDTIILVHTEPDLEKAVFLSFPRDLWVNIPGMGQDKINAAFEGGVNGGGPQRVARTVTELTGVPVDHILY